MQENFTVDMPMMSKYTCSNVCGPAGRCSNSQQQCSSDKDCRGCTSADIQQTNKLHPIEYTPYMGLGMLTGGGSRQIATQANAFQSQLVDTSTDLSDVNANAIAPPYQTWLPKAQYLQKLYNERFRLPNATFANQITTEPNRSLTGLFVSDNYAAYNI